MTLLAWAMAIALLLIGKQIKSPPGAPRVTATPTVVLIGAGTVREFIVGARPASTVRALLAVP